jgi:hypothetical protein
MYKWLNLPITQIRVDRSFYSIIDHKITKFMFITLWLFWSTVKHFSPLVLLAIRTFYQIRSQFKIYCTEKYSLKVWNKRFIYLCLTILSYFTFIVNRQNVSLLPKNISVSPTYVVFPQQGLVRVKWNISAPGRGLPNFHAVASTYSQRNVRLYRTVKFIQNKRPVLALHGCWWKLILICFVFFNHS